MTNGVTLHLKSGKKLRADALLWANGRTGNTDHMGLDQIGIEPNQRGQIAVDERYRTKFPHIHAVGDAIGTPSLASAAYGQGRAASADAIGVPGFRYVDDVPTGIYTIPEISSLGPTERELTESRRPYEVGQALFQETARAQITGDTVGMLKLLFDPVTHEILGIHCFGDQASEIVHIGQAIMSQEGPGQHDRLFREHHLQLPDHGRSLSHRGLGWLEPDRGRVRPAGPRAGRDGAAGV